ncbi:hypothetical protein DLM75_07055 [Leptospira stimsonii]|uniref:Uncharacterized protein n=1 Tax=Leptospira stimsonii TaxID=2202203 RepID=A0A396ZEH0_9LEPT|nr:hypothetical protein DLM75_07055 [Leptospira stimsonii]
MRSSLVASEFFLQKMKSKERSDSFSQKGTEIDLWEFLQTLFRKAFGRIEVLSDFGEGCRNSSVFRKGISLRVESK